MSDELLAVVPVVKNLNNQEQVLIQADQVQQADMQLATPTEEQIHSADGVFSQAQKTDQDLTAFLAVTTGLVVLHDMAVDRFSSHEEEEEEEKDQREKK